MSATRAIDSLTMRSAVASETQSGTTGPNPINGNSSPAHDTSLVGSSMLRLAENAIVKNRAVSSVEPMSEDNSGARHQ